MVRAHFLRHYKARKICRRQQHRHRNVRQQHLPFSPDKDRTLPRKLHGTGQRTHFFRRQPVTVVPGHRHRLFRRKQRARKHVANQRIQRPALPVRCRPLTPHRQGRPQLQRSEDGVQNVAAHVPKCRGPEIQPLAPVARVVHVFDEWPRRRHAQPVVPVQTGRYHVRPGFRHDGQPLTVAPLLLTPRVDFFHLPDYTALNHPNGRLILAPRMNLNPHLRGQLLLSRHLHQGAYFMDVMRQRLLHIHGQARTHGTDGERCVHMIRRAHTGGIQLAALFVQHLPPVPVQTRPGILLLHTFQPVRIHLSHANQFHFGV